MYQSHNELGMQFWKYPSLIYFSNSKPLSQGCGGSGGYPGNAAWDEMEYVYKPLQIYCIHSQQGAIQHSRKKEKGSRMKISQNL